MNHIYSAKYFLSKMYYIFTFKEFANHFGEPVQKGVLRSELPRLYAVLCGGARINETEYSFDHYEIQCFNQDKNP